MKKLIFIVLLSLLAVPAFAQSKLGVLTYSENHIYLCPGFGVKHDNLTTAQPKYWYGGQLIMELNEKVELVGRVKWDFGGGTAEGSKPSGELGIWYKIGL